VTERVTNNLDAFHVEADGRLSPIIVNANPAPGTFTVNYAPNNFAIVSETGPAAGNNASGISSYKVNANGTLTAVTQSLPTFASGNCWNAITPDGTKVYVSNSASNDISGFNIGKDGKITPRQHSRRQHPVRQPQRGHRGLRQRQVPLHHQLAIWEHLHVCD
jgi:6-phosphogluconolactonase